MRYIPSFLKNMLAAALILLPMAAFAAPQPEPLKTAWLGEYEAFPIWYAKEKGWDKEAGFNVEMLRFESGKALIEGMKAYKWSIGGCGAVPTVSTSFSDSFSIVAVAGDESSANTIFVRPDSPILKVKGNEAEYPEVFGNAATVKGKKVLCPQGTSAHYTLVNWLKAIGLTEKDVRVQFMHPMQATGAFKGGVGDILVTWAPYTYAAESAGFKRAAVAADCRLELPLVLLADKKFAAEHADTVKSFLKLYQRSAAVLTAEPTREVVDAYMRFSKEWAGRILSEAEVLADLRTHNVYSVEEQNLYLNDGIGLMKQVLERIGQFRAGHGAEVILPAVDGSMLPTRP